MGVSRTDNYGSPLVRFCYYAVIIIGMTAWVIGLATAATIATDVPSTALPDMPCPVGHFVDMAGVCAACAIGTASNVEDANECTACGSGFFAPAGSPQCMPCSTHCLFATGTCDAGTGVCWDNPQGSLCIGGFYGTACDKVCMCGDAELSCGANMGTCTHCAVNWGLVEGTCTQCTGGFTSNGQGPCVPPS